MRMAKEEVSKIYGKPKFGLIVAMFVAAIVVCLVAGWLVIRYRQPRVKENILPRTGMMYLYSRQ